jgi:hypothetical protein
MGSNMMRQSVPLLRPHPPIVGTGMEDRVATDSRSALASTNSTVPLPGDTTAERESVATRSSIPVPTIGGCGLKSGTDCRIILEPMRARLASSFSKKGISEADTLTSWFGETSI